jgi:hypothetical protein
MAQRLLAPAPKPHPPVAPAPKVIAPTSSPNATRLQCPEKLPSVIVSSSDTPNKPQILKFERNLPHLSQPIEPSIPAPSTTGWPSLQEPERQQPRQPFSCQSSGSRFSGAIERPNGLGIAAPGTAYRFVAASGARDIKQAPSSLSVLDYPSYGAIKNAGVGVKQRQFEGKLIDIDGDTLMADVDSRPRDRERGYGGGGGGGGAGRKRRYRGECSS